MQHKVHLKQICSSVPNFTYNTLQKHVQYLSPVFVSCQEAVVISCPGMQYIAITVSKISQLLLLCYSNINLKFSDIHLPHKSIASKHDL